MALRSGYKGFKKLLPGLKIIRPGTLGIDNDVLSKTYYTRAEEMITGAKNFLNNVAKTSTNSGITYTVDSDKIVTLSGTAGETTSSLALSAAGVFAEAKYQREFILSGTPKALGGDDYCLQLRDTDNHHIYYNGKEVIDTGTGCLVDFSKLKLEDNTSVDPSTVRVIIRIAAGKASGSGVFKPMLRLSSDPDDTYAPYVMTNTEIMDNLLTKLFSNPVERTRDNDLDDVTTPGIYTIGASVPTHAPAGMSNTFACVMVLNTGGAATQIYIQGGWRTADNHVAIRGLGGSPAAWSNWRYFTDALPT